MHSVMALLSVLFIGTINSDLVSNQAGHCMQSNVPQLYIK